MMDSKIESQLIKLIEVANEETAIMEFALRENCSYESRVMSLGRIDELEQELSAINFMPELLNLSMMIFSVLHNDFFKIKNLAVKKLLEEEE